MYSYNEWLANNYDELSTRAAEEGYDREYDFDFESWTESLYEEYVTLYPEETGAWVKVKNRWKDIPELLSCLALVEYKYEFEGTEFGSAYDTIFISSIGADGTLYDGRDNPYPDYTVKDIRYVLPIPEAPY